MRGKGRAQTRRQLVQSAMNRLQAATDFDMNCTLPAAEADALLRHILSERYRHDDRRGPKRQA